jgi:hypothetical protein
MTTRKEKIGTETTDRLITQAGSTKAVREVKEKDIFKMIYICDWCGVESDKNFLDGSITNDEQLEVTFYALSGTGIYLGASGGWEVDDLCRPCIDKLKKLLEDAGITLSSVDW